MSNSENTEGTSTNIVDSTLTSWVVLEHVKSVKRWREDDLEWIKLAQELARQSLIALTGQERAMKMMASSRIALRRKQDEIKRQRTGDKITTDPETEDEVGRSK